jgi:hypothetical protein
MKVLLVIIVLALVGYSLFLIAVPHYNYYAFRSDIDEYLRVAIDYEKRIRDDIFEMAKGYDIPIEKDDIYLYRHKHKTYDVNISWDVTVDFFTLYQKTFFFEIETSS